MARECRTCGSEAFPRLLGLAVFTRPDLGKVRYQRQLYDKPWSRLTIHSRGNQRELARQKNMKKAQEHNKGKRKEDALSASQRKQRDSEIMQQKQKAADQKKSSQTGTK